jgi:hypothetical protein
MGAPAPQSVLLTQPTQRPCRPQTGVAVPAQSALAAHWTHCDVAELHRGAVAEHWASLVQPATHRNSPDAQTGAAAPQSALERHCSHVPSRNEQRGAELGQSEFAAHSRHRWVTPSQTGRLAGQSAEVLHPTHVPEGVQRGVLPEHESWLQAGRHRWSPGKHAGAAAPQSALLRHDSQLPRMQNFSDAGHCSSVVHSTQPSVTSHCRVDPHWFVPLVPQSAPAPEGPPAPSSLDPHAAKIMANAATMPARLRRIMRASR